MKQRCSTTANLKTRRKAAGLLRIISRHRPSCGPCLNSDPVAFGNRDVISQVFRCRTSPIRWDRRGATADRQGRASMVKQRYGIDVSPGQGIIVKPATVANFVFKIRPIILIGVVNSVDSRG